MNKYRLFVWMIILASLAGLINSVAVFCYAGATVSHITGLVSKFSISVSTGVWGECLYLAGIVSAFFVGAVAAGIATGERAFYLHKVYGFIIIFIGILVLVPVFFESEYCVMLLAFLMGLQNGMVVSFKGIVVRLTHMTGNLTDFGVFVGYRIRGNRNERPLTGMIPLSTLLGFAAGGVIGILLYNSIGVYVFAAASVVYILLGLVYFRFRKTCNDKDFNGVPDEEEEKTA